MGTKSGTSNSSPSIFPEQWVPTSESDQKIRDRHPKIGTVAFFDDSAQIDWVEMRVGEAANI